MIKTGELRNRSSWQKGATGILKMHQFPASFTMPLQRNDFGLDVVPDSSEVKNSCATWDECHRPRDGSVASTWSLEEESRRHYLSRTFQKEAAFCAKWRFAIFMRFLNGTDDAIQESLYQKYELKPIAIKNEKASWYMTVFQISNHDQFFGEQI